MNKKSYLDVPAKRLVQNYIAEKLKLESHSSFIGLADIYGLDSYENFVSKLNTDSTNTKFIGFDQMFYLAQKNPSKYLWGDINLEVRENPYDVIDADFCKSCINNGDDLINIISWMNQNNPDRLKTLMFTLSIRGVGVHKTLEFFKQNIYLNNFKVDYIYEKSKYEYLPLNYRGYLYEIKHTQNTFLQSQLFQYRDTDHMISGAISWKKIA